MGSECSTQSSACDEGRGTCGTGAGATCKACGTGCGGDPTECASAMWTQSFFQAMKAAQVEALKAKIQKAWGAKMDKAADIILEAMGAKWQSMLAETKAKQDVRAKLQSLWHEGR